MDQETRRAAIALHDRFTHEGGDRRTFLADMARLAGGAAAANALLLAIAADPAAAAIVAADDQRVAGGEVAWATTGRRTLKGYHVRLAGAVRPRASVLVVHENRGLTEHIRDVARRVALAGYDAVAADFLSGAGGTPADQDAARAAIGRLDLAATTADAVATLDWLRTVNGGRPVGIVGFCWGGAMVNRVAVAAGDALAAGVSYYGPAPDPAEAAKVRSPLLLQLAERDDRVNATGRPWAEALGRTGRPSLSIVWPGAEHAFNNDTSAERYDKPTADAAWAQTLRWFEQHLR